MILNVRKKGERAVRIMDIKVSWPDKRRNVRIRDNGMNKDKFGENIRKRKKPLLYDPELKKLPTRLRTKKT